MMDMEAFGRYLAFVPARHRVWELRQAGAAAPWSDDMILKTRKFTNVYRVLDYGSQFVISDLHEPGVAPEEFLMRIFLYRQTGRVEAWKHLLNEFGSYPLLEDLDDVLEAWAEYKDAGGKIFTPAYLVYPQSSVPGTDKTESIVRLTQRVFGEGVGTDFLAAETQEARFATLRRNKGVADFMSMQILTDYGYSPFGGDTENDFVVPGPGARKGVAAITDTKNVVGFLKYARSEVLAGDDCPQLALPGGGLRPPSLMDIQNTMCEFSKYERYLEKGTPATGYQPAHPGEQPKPLLPQNWAADSEGTKLP